MGGPEARRGEARRWRDALYRSFPADGRLVLFSLPRWTTSPIYRTHFALLMLLQFDVSDKIDVHKEAVP